MDSCILFLGARHRKVCSSTVSSIYDVLNLCSSELSYGRSGTPAEKNIGNMLMDAWG